MNYLLPVLAAVIGYLFGSFSPAVIISSSLCGGDIRKKGSGNAGATNIARVYGMKAALLTLACDMIKTVLAIYIGKLICGEVGFAAGGIGCMLGHCFPVFFGFRGGKGVAAGAAVALMIDWRVFVCIIAVFLIVAFATRKVSLGSSVAALATVVSSVLFHTGGARITLAVCGTILVLIQHRENFKRLIAGTEPDFRAAKDKI